MTSFSTFYRVTIAGVTAAAPADGFIDNGTVERYLAEAPMPGGFSFAQAVAKERANVRYDMVVAQMGLMANLYVDNITKPAAAANAAPSSFAFTVEVERGDTVLDTHDELNSGARITGANAIRRCVARALVLTKDDFADIYDPTATPAPGNTTVAARMGVRIQRITVGALFANLAAAEAGITVTKIANVG